jgi:proline iminopeptidase
MKTKNKTKNKTIKKTSYNVNSNKFLCKHSIKKTYHGKLYNHPKKALKTYRMRVSDLHTISFSTFGNPNGKPVVYVHGGPGGGTRPSMARFFNPKKYYIVLIDQRGCGKSKPTGELRENTTQDLVNDFEKVRKKLGIKKWMVFGGSWGSTLALYYAMAHPEVTTHLIVRAIFLGTKSEVDWLSEPDGAENLNPIGWEYYVNAIPKKYRTNKFVKDYGKCFAGKFGEKTKSDCLLAWSAWEDMNLKLHMPTLEHTINELKKDKIEYETIAKIEYYYFINNCFMEDGYLLKKENIDKIRHIPTKIIQGVYDIICPFKYAYLLHKAFPEAEFYPTMAGHSSYDEENIKHIVESTNDFSK